MGKSLKWVKHLVLLSVLILKSQLIFPQVADGSLITYTIKQGLSSNAINCILKDRKGFLWVGTREGLNRFDGYGFKKFYSVKGDSSTLSDNNISSIAQDHDGNLWIGTPNGLNKYNTNTGKFTQFYVNWVHNNSIAYNDISSTYVDKAGNVWIGTLLGVSKYNTKTKKFLNYYRDSTKHNSLSSSAVLCLAGKANGNLLIGMYNGGVNELNPKTNVISSEINDRLVAKKLSNFITNLFVDSEGIIWMGTFDSGLIKYDPVTKELTSCSPEKGLSMPKGVSSIISKDKDHLWVSSIDGLFLFNKATKKWIHYDKQSDGKLYHEEGERLWIGTSSKGLLQKNFNQFKFRTTFTENIFPGLRPYLSEIKQTGNLLLFGAGDGFIVYNTGTETYKVHSKSKDLNGLTSNYIHKIFIDSKNKVWILTDLGLNEYDIKSGIVKRTKISEEFYYDMLEIGKGEYWLAYDGGIYVYNDYTKKIRQLKTENLSEHRVRCLLRDSKNNLWVGTVNGLNKYNKSTKEFINFYSDPIIAGAISNNEINSIYEDSKKRLWVCTNNGLNKYNPRDSTFEVFNVARGLSTNYIKNCVEDNLGNLWLSTGVGISRLTNKETINNYDERDGISIAPVALTKTVTGELIFVGDKGFIAFDPRLIKNNLILPQVCLTDFTVYNKQVPVTEGGILNKEISSASEIRLSYKESVFTFSFAALNYLLPEKNQYAYKMEGFDGWNYVGDKRSATYTNLDPGEYVFRVKASNNDGVWNVKGTSIKVIITPPFWATWWFRALSIITLFAFAFGVYRYRMNQIILQQKELEHQIKLRTAEISQQSLELKEQAENLQAVNEELEAQSEELLAMNEELQDERIKSDNANKAKTVFLTTMSHEIRTPMNGVIGMASLLAKTPLSDEQSHYVDIIKSSGDNLVTVINDILDFSKIESGKMELEQRSFNLFDCIEEVFELFSEKASTAVLELLYQIKPDVPEYIIGDSIRLRQIILNLVGNSVKFTKEGEVFLLVSCLKRKGNQVELLFEVRDTGIGISEKKLNSLFQPFTQADSSTTRKYGGSGLGLAISKRLVELMKGEISAKSELGKGSSFFFNVQTTEGTGEIKKHPESTDLSGKCILVVDDNATSRTVLQSYLESWEINAVLVASAAEALAQIGHTDFDLVITDMCMPEMDGLQLAKRVKETKTHLPVMLINTLGQDCFEANNQLFCGAVIKPVRRNELKKMIVNQFSTSQSAAKSLDKEPEQFSAEFSQKFPLDILVAEDNLVNQTLILTMMDKLGYKIDFAANGSEAVEAVKIEKYDLILMDMQMPEMDGLEATKEIRKLNIARQPTIIALTANAMQDDKNICLAAGMNDYMAKPLRFEKLVEILEKYSLQLKVNA